LIPQLFCLRQTMAARARRAIATKARRLSGQLQPGFAAACRRPAEACLRDDNQQLSKIDFKYLTEN
jgi:hypothetical protein